MKILKANCGQVALLESMLQSSGVLMRISPVGSNRRTFEVQSEFKPIMFVNHCELQARDGMFPVRVDFEYNVNDNMAFISTNRKGIDCLKELYPDTFAKIEMVEDDKKTEEKEFEVKIRPAKA